MKPQRITEHMGVRILHVEEATAKRGPRIEAQLIRAGMSLNRRFYPASVLRSAVGLYEGKKVMLDHADWLSPESVKNIAALIVGAQWDPTEEAVRATIVPAMELDSGQLLMNLARSQARYRQDGVLGEDEHLFGFSHVALVTGEAIEPEDGETPPHFEVEEIREVMSVDAVAFPAAGGEMKNLAESRRAALLERLDSEGQIPRPEAPSPSKPPEPSHRKVTIMSKSKTRQTFDLSGVVVQIEGVERSAIEPALQASAQEGYAAATAEAAEKVTTLEAANARVEGERDAAKAKLATYEAAEAAQEAARALHAYMEKKEVPEAARPGLADRAKAGGMTAEQAESMIDAYAEAYKANLKEIAEDADPDLTETTQESKPATEAEEIGAAFAEQWGVPPTAKPADRN